MQIVLLIALPFLGLIFGWIVRLWYARFQLSSSEQRAERLRQDVLRENEAVRKENLLSGREQLQRERNEQGRELKKERNDLAEMQRRLIEREEGVERKLAVLEKQRHQVAEYQKKTERQEQEVQAQKRKWQQQLETVSNLTTEQAKNMIIQSLENEAHHEAQGRIKKIEHEAGITAERNAREILVSNIQRMASEVNTEVTISSVALPNDDMKGRIIGREGRNIRTLETVTGADIIIDDTPEAVIVSCFDPIRKEIARRSLERLISDGRIHPTRIEEVVHKISTDIGQIIFEEGENALYDLDIHNMPTDAIKAIGKLHFRTSYGQNVLAHSKEVAILAGMIASELNADRDVAKRGGILHDVGKSIETDSDSNHVELGVELAKRIGEEERVINAIAAHHGAVPHSCVESVIVQIADAISASRPGARREIVENYIKRLESLEQIAEEFEGVEKAFAIQAGRELRIMVNHDIVSDLEAEEIARKVARNIETHMRYPGRIKITLIREMRITEYAR